MSASAGVPSLEIGEIAIQVLKASRKSSVAACWSPAALRLDAELGQRVHEP